ncbi:MAG: hypothetical protein WC449_05390 [Candidatus Paceibacterota bacterium]
MIDKTPSEWREINKVLAEFDGWGSQEYQSHNGETITVWSCGELERDEPLNYCGSLDLMAKIEEKMKEDESFITLADGWGTSTYWHLYWLNLYKILGINDDTTKRDNDLAFAHAPADVRAVAAWKAITGKEG